MRVLAVSATLIAVIGWASLGVAATAATRSGRGASPGAGQMMMGGTMAMGGMPCMMLSQGQLNRLKDDLDLTPQAGAIVERRRRGRQA